MYLVWAISRICLRLPKLCAKLSIIFASPNECTRSAVYGELCTWQLYKVRKGDCWVEAWIELLQQNFAKNKLSIQPSSSQVSTKHHKFLRRHCSFRLDLLFHGEGGSVVYFCSEELQQLLPYLTCKLGTSIGCNNLRESVQPINFLQEYVSSLVSVVHIFKSYQLYHLG